MMMEIMETYPDYGMSGFILPAYSSGLHRVRAGQFGAFPRRIRIDIFYAWMINSDCASSAGRGTGNEHKGR
jgi:hypothetical protein